MKLSGSLEGVPFRFFKLPMQDWTLSAGKNLVYCFRRVFFSESGHLRSRSAMSPEFIFSRIATKKRKEKGKKLPRMNRKQANGFKTLMLSLLLCLSESISWSKTFFQDDLFVFAFFIHLSLYLSLSLSFSFFLSPAFLIKATATYTPHKYPHTHTHTHALGQSGYCG